MSTLLEKEGKYDKNYKFSEFCVCGALVWSTGPKLVYISLFFH